MLPADRLEPGSISLLRVVKALMARIELTAINQGTNLLRVPSSITAEGFYASLGFKKIRDEFHGSERTVAMAKALEQPLKAPLNQLDPS